MKGLSFSGPMMLAWLAGRKDVTRRLIPPKLIERYYEYDDWCISVTPRDIPCSRDYEKQFFTNHSRYTPGETVYIKEDWKFYGFDDDGFPHIQYRCDGKVVYFDNIPDEHAEWMSDIWAKLSHPDNFKRTEKAQDKSWRSSLLLPEFLSRDRILIQSARPERIQSITDEEIAREGLDVNFHEGDIATACVDLKSKRRYSTARECFRSLWETLHPGSWEKNEWGFGYELEKAK
jgi:hypothetical protein